MDGHAYHLFWVNDNVSHLEVPYFQRPYVWQDEHFQALLDAIMEASAGTMPFFGSVILKDFEENDDSTLKKYYVIDGQQRITTFSILIRSLLDLIALDNISISDTILVQMKSFIYKIDINSSGDEVYSNILESSHVDKEFFEKIMDATQKRISKVDGKYVLADYIDKEKSQLYAAYEFFINFFTRDENYDCIKEFCLKLRSITKSLIYITLQKLDDEQKIFDSVNSLGKSLTNSDIIKNYLFQKLKEQARNDSHKMNGIMDTYNKYWDSVFYDKETTKFWYDEFTVGRLTTDNLECFLKDYAILKKIYAAKKNSGSYGLCNAYKLHIDKLSYDGIVDFIKEIHEYAKVYYQYKSDYKNLNDFRWSDYKNRLLLIFDMFNTTTFNPYILKLLKEKPSNLEQQMFLLEKFFLHRFIYNGSKKNYNQCCECLIDSADSKTYLENYMIESPCENLSYKNVLRTLKNDPGKLFIFLLEMYYRNKEEDSYADNLCIKKFELEHVMPQKWQSNDSWMNLDSYTEDNNLIDKNNTKEFIANRKKAVFSLGNYTLLTSKLNNAVSNSYIDVKVNGNGKPDGKGIRSFAANLKVAKKIIENFDNGIVWDERLIFANEKEYFDTLNSIYHFE